MYRPWNFPLAIFTGRIAAALAAGNSVLAKPAETNAADCRARDRHFAGSGCTAGRGAIAAVEVNRGRATDG